MPPKNQPKRKADKPSKDTAKKAKTRSDLPEGSEGKRGEPEKEKEKDNQAAENALAQAVANALAAAQAATPLAGPPLPPGLPQIPQLVTPPAGPPLPPGLPQLPQLPTLLQQSLLPGPSGSSGYLGQQMARLGGTTGTWLSGTSVWDFGLPTSIEAPGDAAVHCPPDLALLLQQGQYVNLSSFIPKESWEEQSTTFQFAEGGVKQTTSTRKVKSIEEWTTAFLRFAGVYCKVHPMKCLELFMYMDLIRQAEKKWGGFGWRAYDEQFRVRQASYTRDWSIIDHGLWALVVTCPQQPPAPKAAHAPPKVLANPTDGPKGGKGAQKGKNQKGKQAAQLANPNQGGGANKSNACHAFQVDACKRPNCRFPHICAWCGGPHQGESCPKKR
jgi:hypothetical protein